MTLVDRAGEASASASIRLVELGFPELGEVFDDPTCRTAREVLRLAPTARCARRRRTTTLADANGAPDIVVSGSPKAERLHDLAADSIAVPELAAEVAFEVGLLLDQLDLLEQQIEARRGPRRRPARRRAGPPPADHPGRGTGDLRRAHRRDRRHRSLRDVRPAPRLCRRPSRRAQLRAQGREPRDVLADVQGGQRPPPRRGLPDRRRRAPSTTRSSPPTTRASARRARAR